MENSIKKFLLYLLLILTFLVTSSQISIQSSIPESSFPVSILEGSATLEVKEYFDGHKWYLVTFNNKQYIYSSRPGSVFQPK